MVNLGGTEEDWEVQGEGALFYPPGPLKKVNEQSPTYGPCYSQMLSPIFG